MKYANGLALSLALVISACVTAYEEVDTNTPFAIFEFNRGFADAGNPLSANTSQAYEIGADAQCDGRNRAASYGWTDGSEAQPRRVAAARQAHIFAHTVFASLSTGGPTGMQETQYICYAYATFVPEAGHSYRVTQRELRHGVCRLEIVDVATSTPPPGLQVNDSREICYDS